MNIDLGLTDLTLDLTMSNDIFSAPPDAYSVFSGTLTSVMADDVPRGGVMVLDGLGKLALLADADDVHDGTVSIAAIALQEIKKELASGTAQFLVKGRFIGSKLTPAIDAGFYNSGNIIIDNENEVH